MPNPSEMMLLHFQQGTDHFRSGRIAEAEQEYRNMLQIDPQSPEANYNLGFIMLHSDRAEPGVSHLRTAYQTRLGDPVFWSGYVNGLCQAKRGGEAQTALEYGMQEWGYAGDLVLELVSNINAARQASAPYPARAIPLPDVVDDAFYELLAKAFPHSMSGMYGLVESFYALYKMVNYVVEYDIRGDFVECGCYAGGMSLFAALAFLKHGETSRGIYLFDTFEGMPAPTSEDGAEAGKTFAAKTTDGQSWAKMDIEVVRNTMAASGYPANCIRLIKGMVEDTIPAQAPSEISILRLDTDFYASTKHELIHLYPRLAAGGALIIDDYAYLPGARAATDEYFSLQDRPMLLHCVNFTVRTGIKAVTRAASNGVQHS